MRRCGGHRRGRRRSGASSSITNTSVEFTWPCRRAMRSMISPNAPIIVGHLSLDRVHFVDCLVEFAEMIVTRCALQVESQECSRGFLLVIFPKPFDYPPIVGKFLVKAAKIGVASARQQAIAGRVPRMRRCSLNGSSADDGNRARGAQNHRSRHRQSRDTRIVNPARIAASQKDSPGLACHRLPGRAQ